MIKRVFFLSLALLIITPLGQALAISSQDSSSLYGDSEYYWPNQPKCDVGSSASSSGGSLASGSSIYILGDSITERAQSAYQTTFQQEGIVANVDAEASRSLNGPGQDGNKTTGMQAIAQDASQIKLAGAIVIALGTNGGDTNQSIDQAIAAIRADNSTAPIYWVDLISVGRTDNYNQTVIGPGNQAIYSQASSQNYQVISWFKTVDSAGDPQNPTPKETDPNHYIDNSDGLGVHPTQAGITALVNLVSGTVTGSSTQTASGASCACSTGNTPLVGSDNIQKAFNFLVGKGLTANQAAAVIGNLEQESGQGLNPSADQNKGTATTPTPNDGFGIAQWTDPGRQQGLVTLAQQEGKPPNDLGVQLDYLWQELTTTHSNALTALKAADNVQSATIAFEQTYEAAGTPQMQNRINFAQAVLTQYGGSAPSGSSQTSSSGCSVGAINCNSSNSATSTSGLSQVRKNVVCIAQQELALWESQPGYPWNGENSYSETGYLKYSEGRHEEWCADFASWVYDQAGYPLQPDPNWNVSYVPNIQSIGEQNIKFHWHPAGSGYTPKPGDLAIHGSQHVNIFISSSGGTSTYIGGDQGNGPYPGGSIVSTDTESGYYSGGITGYVSPD